MRNAKLLTQTHKTLAQLKVHLYEPFPLHCDLQRMYKWRSEIWLTLFLFDYVFVAVFTGAYQGCA